MAGPRRRSTAHPACTCAVRGRAPARVAAFAGECGRDGCDGGDRCAAELSTLLRALARVLREGVGRSRFSTGVVYEYRVEAIEVDPRILARVEYAVRHGRPEDGESYDAALLAAVYADLGVRPDVESVDA